MPQRRATRSAIPSSPFLTGVLLVMALLLAPCDPLGAQPIESRGREFFFVLPDTAIARATNQAPQRATRAWITLFADSTATVTVTFGSFVRSVTVGPDGSTTVQLLDGPDLPERPFLDQAAVVRNGIAHVSADRPISLLCAFATRSGMEAFVPLPVEAWGSDYTATAYPGTVVNYVGFKADNEETLLPVITPSQVIIVAAYDGTDVTIAPTAPTEGGGDTTVRLDRGEAWLVESSYPFFTTLYDLTGTRITATRPIGVMGGSTRSHGGIGAHAVIPIAGNLNSNVLIEWLAPDSLQGHTFVHARLFPLPVDATEEIVRVVATSPGTTTVTFSNGYPPSRLQRGEYVDVGYFGGADSASHPTRFRRPFAIRSDRPVSASIITGSWIEPREVPGANYLMFFGWSPAMSLLTPRERWITRGRFNAPSWPRSLRHVLGVAADSGTRVFIDSLEVPLTPVGDPGTPFLYGRIELDSGDHALRAVGGRCGAVLLGFDRGYEDFRPPAARRDPKGEQLLHPSVLFEEQAPSYAYPITGEDERDRSVDSLTIDRLEKCDSLVVTVRQIGPEWTQLPLTADTMAGGVNARVDIVPVRSNGVAIGFRIRFTPVDPAGNATAGVIVRSPSGMSWVFPYDYHARTFELDPETVEMLDLDVGVEETLPLTLTNATGFNASLLWMRLADGTRGFTLRDLPSLPVAKRPGESVTATLAFTGAARNTDYRDTLIVATDCRIYRIPLHARVGPDPVPTITGYDWRLRRVGSVNDTLSFAGNVGSLPYRIDSVAITGAGASQFSLAPPDWQGIDSVEVGEIESIGIRFAPSIVGDFRGKITMWTVDGQVVDAELHGVAAEPELGISLAASDTLCVGEMLLPLTLRNEGGWPLEVTDLLPSATPPTAVALASGGWTPKTIAPGDSLLVQLRVSALQPSTSTLTIEVRSDGGDTLLARDLTIRSCDAADLVATDHDFDSIFITLPKPGSVLLTNVGAGDVTVTSMTIVGDTGSAFRLFSPTPPFVVREGESVRVYAEFQPQKVGRYEATIVYETTVGQRISRLVGVGRILVVPAFIRRDYHAPPGEERTVLVELGERLDTLPVRQLTVAVGYDHRLLDVLAEGVPAAVDSGWNLFAMHDADSVRFTIDVAGRPPGAGALAAIRFLVRFTLLDSSELPFTIGGDLPYVVFREEPGLFRRDPLCGLEHRLFEFTSNSFRLDQSIPNPSAGETTIEFEIPFEAPTTLVISDALGNELLRPVDQVLLPGIHVVTVPKGALPAGVYYYRLRSGPFVETRRMVIL